MKFFGVLLQYRALPVMGCEKTMTDFEAGLLAAVEEAMPWAEVKDAIYFVKAASNCISYNNYLLWEICVWFFQ